MSKVIINGGSGGTGSDECTAKLSDIPTGLKAVTADSNDEAGTGTMTMTGNAQAGHVLAGETFYTNNYKTKLSGVMTVGSILNFSAQAYSGRQILLTWQNPYAAAGRPFSGIHVWYSTGGYPGAGGGTWIYSGYGGNAASGGWCQTIVTLPNLNTTYYFTACSYVTCSAGDQWGTAFKSAVVTGADLWLTFTGSQNYTVPAGYTRSDVFCVGGGSGGKKGGGGGGGGYTKTVTGIAVSPGQVLVATVGGGGAAGSSGGASLVTRSGTTLSVANGGGSGGIGSSMSSGINGGSGGGSSGDAQSSSRKNGGNGGSNGGNGLSGGYSVGTGQGSTTRAYGNSTGTMYSGGGAGGGSGYSGSIHTGGGSGGAGGGGSGGTGGYRTNQEDYRYIGGTPGANGGANTGGGGGGGGYMYYNDRAPHGSGGNGGSGVVLLHIY